MPVRTSDWRLVSRAGVEFFAYRPSRNVALAFFTCNSTARDKPGSLGLADKLDRVDDGEEALVRARQALGLEAIKTLRQIHSDKVVAVVADTGSSLVPEGDAHMSDRFGLGLGVKVADCLPVYIYSGERACIGIAHCGWRGTVARLAQQTARAMSGHYGVLLPELRFALGPCICSSCYVVGRDVCDRFDAELPEGRRWLKRIEAAGEDARYRLDLCAANREQLTSLGLTEDQPLELCAYENSDLCYSVRRSRTTRRNLAVIALLPPSV